LKGFDPFFFDFCSFGNAVEVEADGFSESGEICSAGGGGTEIEDLVKKNQSDEPHKKRHVIERAHVQ